VFEAVHLVDADNEVGGHLRWTRRLPTLGDWGRICDHRSLQLDKLTNVEVILNTTLDADRVLDYGAQIVVVATGSTWRDDGVQPHRAEPMQGADGSQDHVLTPEQVMVDGKRPAGPQVVVYDSDGCHVGPGVAEQLAGEGYDTHLVTPLPVVSPASEATLEAATLRRHLHDVGVTVHRGVTLGQVAPREVVGTDEFDRPWLLPANGVVLVTQQQPRDRLLNDLRARREAWAAVGIEAVFGIGDCVAPRPISESVFDGHRLAREIDSPDPAVALPYLRERTLP
jgi:dimethylamine/trimethylamine dehydrogenase